MVDTLDSGIVNAITLFAPRRMGKTQFALTDLGPLAASKGWLVAYCNLWDDKSNPAGALVGTLAAVAEPFRSNKRTGKVGVEANLGIVSASAEVSEEAAPRGAPAHITDAFNSFAHHAGRHAKGRRLLLIVDEIQLADPRLLSHLGDTLVRKGEGVSPVRHLSPQARPGEIAGQRPRRA